MVTGINNIMDPTEGGTKITVKRAFQIILAAALAPKYILSINILTSNHTIFIGKRILLKKQ